MEEPQPISAAATPVWVPDAILQRLPIGQPGGEAVILSARLSAGERKALRKRRPIRVSTWAERHRVVTMSSRPGPWRNDLTPYLTGIMDALAFPSVRTGILCKVPQVGGSEAVNNFVGSRIDRDPGPVLYVFPESNTARENSQDRILPMIESSANLSQHLTGWEDDKTSLRIKLHHMPIYMAWAGSASRLANKPIKYVVFDETDKYPPASKREADPITLGEKRVITYPYDHKILKISTPTIETGPIWVAMETEAQVIFDYWVKCPGCGEMQPMVFDQIKWDKVEGEDGKKVAPDPERMKSLQLAWYECRHCQCQWDDGSRDKAASNGEWRSRPTREEKQPLELEYYLDSRRPTKIGFHIPSWISSLVSMSSAAAAFIKGRHDMNARKDFWNAHKAEAFIHGKGLRAEDAIMALQDDRPRGVVPSAGPGDPALVSCLTAGVDTQDNGFWYEIRAWGFGLDLTSWQIREGFVETFAGLEQILWNDVYKDAEGDQYFVRYVVHDSGGHRTSEVYDFARRHRWRLAPFKGERHMAKPHSFSPLKVYPGTNRPIPGDLRLLRADTTYFKNQLASKLDIVPGDPGAWMLHSGTTFDWARQMCAEYKDENGIWGCPSGRDNHGWDCSVYNLVAVDVLDIGNWRPPDARKRRPAPPPASEKRDGNRQGYKRPKWLGR